MKYLCLICAEKMMEHLTEADAAQHYLDYAAFTDSIKPVVILSPPTG